MAVNGFDCHGGDRFYRELRYGRVLYNGGGLSCGGKATADTEAVVYVEGKLLLELS